MPSATSTEKLFLRQTNGPEWSGLRCGEGGRRLGKLLHRSGKLKEPITSNIQN